MILNNKKILQIVLVFLFISPFPFFSQALAGTEDVLFSRNGLQNTDSVVLPTPSGRRLNPSLLPIVEGRILEVGYIGFFDLEESGFSSWGGHGLSGAMIQPLKAGSMGLGLDVFTVNTEDFSSGYSLGLAGSWARILPSGLSIGLGIQTGIAGYQGDLDWSLGIDTGVSQSLGSISIFDNLTWGASFTGLGKEAAPGTDLGGLVSSFTPRAGISGLIGDPKKFSISPSINFSVPGFSNFRMNIGSTINILQWISIETGIGLDANQLILDTVSQRSFFPRFSFSVHVPVSGNTMDIEDQMSYGLSAAPWYGSTWGLGLNGIIPLGNRDRQGPEVESDLSFPLYLSPNNDGIQDREELNITINDESSILGITLSIQQDGIVHYEESRNPEPQGITNGRSFLTYLFTPDPSLNTAQRFPLTGRDNNGQNLVDGTYSVTIDAVDSIGNRSSVTLGNLIIDTEAPILHLSQPSSENRIFSPNDDQNKDTFIIEMSGSVEPVWNAEILDSSGMIVRTLDYNYSSPRDFVWDGTNDDGKKLPDGIYEFKISGKDFAGNSASGELTNIILNSFVDPVRLQISDRAFGPNGNGIKDTLDFIPELSRTEGVVSWQIKVLDRQNTTVRTLQGTGIPPSRIVLNGNNDSGLPLPESTYTAELSVTYQNGNIPRATSPQFIIDRTPPSAQIAREWAVISPDGNGNNDTMLFYQETSPEELWEGVILNTQGQEIFTTTWRGNADFRFEWDGLNNETSLVSDGEYRYILRSTDAAGNSFATDPINFRVDTSEAEYLLSVNFRAFSPNADGIRDNLEISLNRQAVVQIQDYEISITNQSEQKVRTFSGTGSIPQRIIWDGRNQSGTPAADGIYSVNLRVFHSNGTIYETSVGPIVLDTMYPRLTVSASEQIFSPTGDGNKDTILFRGSSSVEDLIIGEVINNQGEIVYRQEYRGTARDMTWDGRNAIGNLVGDGTYIYRLRATDQAGNSTSVTTEPFILDTRVASAFLTLSARGIAPNGNGFFDSIDFGIFLNLTEGLENWSLRIMNDSDLSIKTFRGTTAQEAFTITWDGRSEDNRIVPGRYRGVFEASYTKGDAPQASTSAFLLDVAGPDLRVTTAPVPFSPDGDGIDDEVIFTVRAQDPSGIAAWSLEIFDRTGKKFQEFSGQGDIPARIVWDGRSNTGERVIAAEDYPYRLTALDNLGNSNSLEGVVPTDIFVIREGDKLYIQIASITFEPNSPNLVLTQDSAVGIRNSLIVDRLVQLFDRYPTYRIRIEGHAVNITGTDTEQRNELIPLAESRASSVKSALVARGMDSGRISIEGVGGARPLVPHTDIENRWKNRRVEFILDR